jgi:hypothetical protein
MSRDELITLVAAQAARIARQDGQITAQERQVTALATQLADLVEANEELAGKLARLEHLLSRNSGNSSSPPSKDDAPGKSAPPEKKRRRGGPKRKRGKQPGAPGANLAWSDSPDERTDRFPEGTCDCGRDLAAATDLGVVDRYQQHEIPQVAVRVTQYDQHAVRGGCGRRHTTTRYRAPATAGSATGRTCGPSPSTSWSCTSSHAPLRGVASVVDRAAPSVGLSTACWSVPSAVGRGRQADPA